VGTATFIPHYLEGIDSRNWSPFLFAFGFTAMFVSLTLTYGWMFLEPAPLALTVHQANGLLRITWNRFAATNGVNLEIIDGAEHAAIFVHRSLSNVTYRAQTTDVEVRLGGLKQHSPTEIARCLVRGPQSTASLAKEMAKTQADAFALRMELRRRVQRIDEMQRTANRLLDVPPPRTNTTRWWR